MMPLFFIRVHAEGAIRISVSYSSGESSTELVHLPKRVSSLIGQKRQYVTAEVPDHDPCCLEALRLR